MKKLLLILPFLCNLLFAQDINAVISQTKVAVENAESDSAKAKYLGDLAWYFVQVNLDSALYYGQEALHTAERIENDVLIAQSHNDLATVYMVKGDYEASLLKCKKALSIRQELEDQAGIASIYFKMGNNFNKLSLYDSTMHYYFKALDYYESVQDSVVATNLQSNISSTYYSMGNYDKALEYLKGPIQFFADNEDNQLLSNSLMNMGNIQLALKDTTSAIASYVKSEKYAEQSQNLGTIAAIYNNYANIYTNQNKFDLAVDYIQKSIKIREELGLLSDLESSKLTLALSLFRMGEYETALPKMLQIKNAFEDIQAKEKLKEIYLSLSYMYAYKQKPDSVNFYNKKYVQVLQVLHQENTLKSSQEIEVRYQTEKKEKEILEQRAKLAEQKLYIIIFLSLLLLSILLGFLIYNQQKNKNKQLQKENELKDALIKIETQNKLQEQRLRISRDLHDNIGAQLTFVISSIDNLKFAFGKENTKVETKLSNISNFTRGTINELRDTIWAMNKEAITLEDLKTRISNFIDDAKLSLQGTDFSFNYDAVNFENYTFTSQDGMNIYRVIQEAINNAMKHAQANKIDVQFHFGKTEIKVNIKDNGKGFDPDEIENGNGMSSMQKRANELNGTLKMSRLEQGMLVSLIVPKKGSYV